jgi:hypothetical protein
MYDLAKSYKYNLSIIYWHRPNVFSCNNNAYYASAIVPIAVFSSFVKPSDPFKKKSIQNLITYPSCTIFETDPIRNSVLSIYQQPWELYFQLIAPYFNPTLKVFLFLLLNCNYYIFDFFIF